MDETPKMRALIYLDDVLQTEGSVEIRSGFREVPIGPGDPMLDPEELTSFSSLHACIVNGRPARPVGPAVIDVGRQTVIWRFKTTS